mmetsp:Transcript_2554/g.5921  ORF Transcript_2554/g.5921 Transcript_2554/m.5921 type:complete len:255 (-) Transcript_2554:909-1673(-)
MPLFTRNSRRNSAASASLVSFAAAMVALPCSAVIPSVNSRLRSVPSILRAASAFLLPWAGSDAMRIRRETPSVITECANASASPWLRRWVCSARLERALSHCPRALGPLSPSRSISWRSSSRSPYRSLTSVPVSILINPGIRLLRCGTTSKLDPDQAWRKTAMYSRGRSACSGNDSRITTTRTRYVASTGRSSPSSPCARSRTCKKWSLIQSRMTVAAGSASSRVLSPVKMKSFSAAISARLDTSRSRAVSPSS